MGRQADLEGFILQSYKIISENERKLITSNAQQNMQLNQDNESLWKTVENWLKQYAMLCESLELKPHDDIIEIATTFPELFKRLKSIAATKSSVPPPTPPTILVSSLSDSTHQASAHPTETTLPSLKPSAVASGSPEAPFKIEYQCVQPFVLSNVEKSCFTEGGLAQFIVELSNSYDIDFTYIDIPTHVCLILDISGSMDAPDKYPYLLKAIPYVLEALSDNDWLSVILFSTQSEIIWSKSVAQGRGAGQQIVQRIEQSNIKFETTHLAPGLKDAMKVIERVNQQQSGMVTRLYVLTDGQLHDAQACYALNADLRRLELEVNSYGFGADFAGDTMRSIMEGCRGATLKWIGDTSMLWQTFRHIGSVAQRIIATDATFELTFSPSVTPGDAFRVTPGKKWFRYVGESFYEIIGGLEWGRKYRYAFEVRLYSSNQEYEHIGTVNIGYTFNGVHQTLTQPIHIRRSSTDESSEPVHKDAARIFLSLEALRSLDPATQLQSFQAELEILREEDGDQARIRLLERAIRSCQNNGNFDQLSLEEWRQLKAEVISKPVSHMLDDTSSGVHTTLSTIKVQI